MTARYSQIPAALVTDPDEVDEIPVDALDDLVECEVCAGPCVEDDGWWECPECSRMVRDGDECRCSGAMSWFEEYAS
jgi:hypothetical protein